MRAGPAGPVVHEINTAAWLHDVSRRTGAGSGDGNGDGAPVPITLGEVPAAEWDAVTPPGIDAVWLMGVWERSPEGVRLALDSPGQMTAFRHALPDLGPDDVIGSAYCVRRYEVDARFGGRQALARARAALAERGVDLLVDFVPNHVAPDHAWLAEHPDRFVRGTAEDLARDPGSFLAVGGNVIARGRDPNYPPWPDVAQLDAFAPGLRQAAVDTLVDIGHQADGVRCDMAMLLLDEVFIRTWAGRTGPPLAQEYWAEVIDAVRAAHPDFLFVAEAYWDLEWRLRQLGFDHCYDKRLYDRLAHGGPTSVRAHLQAGVDEQRHLIRFVENHDEPRAAATFGPAQQRAAAVVVATLPGATLWHEGQFDGRRVHVPVHLARRPEEPVDEDLRIFHLALVAAAAQIRDGDWALCPTSGWPGDASHDQLLAWCWSRPEGGPRSLVVVNDADVPASGRVHVPWPDLADRWWQLDDPVSGQGFTRDGTEIATEGLYVRLPPWGFHILTWAPVAGPDPQLR